MIAHWDMLDSVPTSEVKVKMMFFHSVFCILLTTSICEANFTALCQPCICHKDKLYGGMTVDCSKQNLTSIPENLPVNTTSLLVNNNKLLSLNELNLRRLTHLRFLDLSSNLIQTVEENAFSGQSILLILNLSSNALLLNSSTYKPHVFKPLRKLSVLRIEDNNNPDRALIQHATYPDESFKYLTSLKELHIDGIPADFGPGFAKMKNLTILSLTGVKSYCQVPVLRNTTFVNVPTVQHLNISKCNVNKSELLTFAPLTQIRTVDISYNDALGFSGFGTATFGLQHSPIEILKLNHIYPEYDVCSRLQTAHIIHLRNTKLKELHLDSNGIIGIQLGAITSLPASLELVSARYNKFQYGWYIMETLGLKSLKYFDVSGINKVKSLPFLKRHAGQHPYGFNMSAGSPVPVPPKLETLIAADCSFNGKITPGGVSKNNLKEVIVKNNFFTGLYGPVSGFEKVEHFDFSNNILEDIRDYFAENNSISNISLANNFLGRAIGKDTEGKMFSRLTKTSILDLSSNRIAVLPDKVFTGLVRVEILHLSDNYLSRFSVDLKNNRNLSLLNLRGNKLQMLPPAVLKELEHVSAIDLLDNPLLCSCGSLYFLKWVKDNRHRIIDLDRLTCSFSTPDSTESLRDLVFIIEKLEKACTNNIVTVSVLSFFLFVLGVISASICYRHRWKIRYVYHVGLRAYRHKRTIDSGDDDTFQYDVYVSYSATDTQFVFGAMRLELEDNAGLKMCIYDRDILPGEVRATAVVNAIQNSRKTLILLSPSFMKNEWCEFEYQMARMEGITHRENVLIIALYKFTPIQDLPKDMAVMLRNNCYFEYSEEELGKAVFWERILEAIKSRREKR